MHLVVDRDCGAQDCRNEEAAHVCQAALPEGKGFHRLAAVPQPRRHVGWVRACAADRFFLSLTRWHVGYESPYSWNPAFLSGVANGFADLRSEFICPGAEGIHLLGREYVAGKGLGNNVQEPAADNATQHRSDADVNQCQSR